MTFTEDMLQQGRPDALWSGWSLPRRERYFPSPVDWRNQVFYFLLVDRFSDGDEQRRPLLDRSRIASARPDIDGQPWRWDLWSKSGQNRWQGGTLAGVESKLDYLAGLGITALWLSPVFKQRRHLDTFHGYGIQDFLEVDPHFGTREDLVRLVESAHGRGLRVILDIIFNHSGSNWCYPGDGDDCVDKAPYRPFPERHPFGRWRDGEGIPQAAIAGPEDGVWPRELQTPDTYVRAGTGSLGAGDVADPQAEHKRSDFENLRAFHLDSRETLNNLARCYKYWIALTDCDGFRIDTLKHVTLEQGRNFCGSIKEFAFNIGKEDFFLVGEVAGGDTVQDHYLDAIERNLNAALDICELKGSLGAVARGLAPGEDFFNGFTPPERQADDPRRRGMGSHRNLGDRHVSILDDHDHVCGQKRRFSADASSEHQVAAGVALQLLTLGIPCLYYGTEVALPGGPEPQERQWLHGWGSEDRYLREAMFGPDHPRAEGSAGIEGAADTALPGFGPHGTAGRHCFDPDHPAFRRIAGLARLRAAWPVLRFGRQYQRPISLFRGPFAMAGSGELVAWSRILDDEEALCVLNSHGTDPRGGDVLVDADLSPAGSELTVVYNSAESAGLSPGSHPVGSRLTVHPSPGGERFVEIRDLGPSEILVIGNHP